MINHMAANTGASDYNIGSVIRTFLESVTLVIDEAYFQLIQMLNGFYINSASGSDLDKRLSDFGLQRYVSQPATILLSFTSSSGTPTVPAGTFCTVAATVDTPSLNFVTTAAGTATTTGGANIPAVCTTAGSVGNLTSISYSTWTISNPTTGVISVTNSSVGYNGFNQESDSQFRARGIAFLSSLSKGTNNAIVGACLNSVHLDTSTSLGITQALILENYLLTYPATFSGYSGYSAPSGVSGYTGVSGYVYVGYSQENTDLNTVPAAVLCGISGYSAVSFPGNITVVSDNGLGSLGFDVITELVPIINGDPSQPTLYPGYRSAGIKAWMTRPSILTPASITLTIKLNPSVLTPDETIVDCQTAISTYSTTLAVGGTLYKSEIISSCMGVDGVVDVSSVTIAGADGFGNLPASDPATRITVNASTIAITTTY
jgi:hypothetical protein